MRFLQNRIGKFDVAKGDKTGVLAVSWMEEAAIKRRY
jgi:hypothetical protein